MFTERIMNENPKPRIRHYFLFHNRGYKNIGYKFQKFFTGKKKSSSYISVLILLSRIRGREIYSRNRIKKFLRRINKKNLWATISVLFFRSIFVGNKYSWLRFYSRNRIQKKLQRKNCALRFRSHFFVPYSWATNIRVRNSENFYKDNKKKLRATKSIPFFRSIFVAKNLFLLRFLKIFTKIIRKNCGLRSRSHFFVPYSWLRIYSC